MDKDIHIGHPIVASAVFALGLENKDALYKYLNMAYKAGVEAMAKEYSKVTMEYGYPDWVSDLMEKTVGEE